MNKRHLPLLPKATAMWLVDNTALAFDQIADFTGLHELEVQAMADQEAGSSMTPTNPIYNGELTQEEIDRVAADPKAASRSASRPCPSRQPAPKVRATRRWPSATTSRMALPGC